MANAVMTESTFGSSGLNTIATLIADNFIQGLRSRVRPLNFVRSVGEKFASQKGGSVVVPLVPTISSNLLTDGNAVTLDDTAGSSVTITLNKHRYCSFGETMIAQTKSSDSGLATQMQGRLNGLFNDVEADVLSVVTSGFTTNVVGSYNSAMTEANAIAGMNALLVARVPQDAPLIGLTYPTANSMGALMAIANFANSAYRGSVNMPGPVARSTGYAANVEWHGAIWNATTSVPKNSTSIDACVFHPDAICVGFSAIKLPTSGAEGANFVDAESRIAFQVLKSWNKDRIGEEWTIHTLYGYGAGRESFGLLFKC